MTNRIARFALAFAVIGTVSGAVALARPKPVPIKPDCKFVLCAYPDCLENEHTVIPEGQCCPVCVPN